MAHLKVYTDGGTSLKGQQGFGAWAFVIPKQGSLKKMYRVWGTSPLTSSNIMEVTAGIEAIKFIVEFNLLGGVEFDGIEIITDSVYHATGGNKNLKKWVERRWRNCEGEVITNYEVWLDMYKTIQGLDIFWTWVRAHSGNEYNNMADCLVKQAIKEKLSAKVIDTHDNDVICCTKHGGSK